MLSSLIFREKLELKWIYQSLIRIVLEKENSGLN